jgi:subtilisin
MRTRTGSLVTRRRLAVVFAVSLVGSLTAFDAGAAPQQSKTERWIVVLKDGTDPDAVARSVAASTKQRYTSALTGFAADLTGAQLEKLDRDLRVVSLNPNRVVGRVPDYPGASQEIPPGHPPQFITNGVRRIGGLESPTANIDNQPNPMDVDIAILDSGSGPHLDLNVVGGADCAAGDGFDDVDGHGTLVAGFAAAQDNAFGAVGIAPGARIWSVRVGDPDDTITTENVLCGLDWVRQHAGVIDVTNMSFGIDGTVLGKCGVAKTKTSGPAGPATTLKKRDIVDPVHFAMCQVDDAGVTQVAAAGNEFVDASGITPAAYPEVISVSGLADADGQPGGTGAFVTCEETEVDDTFAHFSNFGKVIEIAAPAVCISSTFINNTYVTSVGTSFSAPLTAGAAGLLKMRHPEWSPKEVRKHLVRTAERGPIPGDPDHFHEGILNVRGY